MHPDGHAMTSTYASGDETETWLFVGETGAGVEENNSLFEEDVLQPHRRTKLRMDRIP